MRSDVSPILVSGASTGLGRTIVKALSKKEYPVYAGARKESDLKDLGELPCVTPVRLDVTDPSDLGGLVEDLQRAGSGLRGLVNNAGICDVWPLMESTEADLARILRVNLYGLHNLTRAVFPFLRDSHGRIVNISSIAGILTPKNLGAYNMSKHAVEAYSGTLTKELRETPIHISLVEPGRFNTNVFKSIKSIYAERAARKPGLSSESLFANIQDGLNQTIQSYGEIDTSASEKVSDAVLDALFSDNPKPRYLVARADEVFYWVANALLSKLVQINHGSEYGVTRQELHELLDSALDDTQGG